MNPNVQFFLTSLSHLHVPPSCLRLKYDNICMYPHTTKIVQILRNLKLVCGTMHTCRVADRIVTFILCTILIYQVSVILSLVAFLLAFVVFLLYPTNQRHHR